MYKRQASSGASGLSPEAREALKGLKKSIHIQVFNLPLLSHGGANDHRLAVESDLIRADMIEASEFPHLANRYGVYAVPRVVMNERVSLGSHSREGLRGLPSQSWELVEFLSKISETYAKIICRW